MPGRIFGILIMHILFCLFVGDRVPLHSPGCPWTCRDQPTCASQVLGLEASTTMAQQEDGFSEAWSWFGFALFCFSLLIYPRQGSANAAMWEKAGASPGGRGWFPPFLWNRVSCSLSSPQFDISLKLILNSWYFFLPECWDSQSHVDLSSAGDQPRALSIVKQATSSPNFPSTA